MRAMSKMRLWGSLAGFEEGADGLGIGATGSGEVTMAERLAEEAQGGTCILLKTAWNVTLLLGGRLSVYT